MMTARHLLSMPSCAATRAMGLAPAKIGHPGYWPKQDADNDGIACEEWGGGPRHYTYYGN